MIGSNNAWNVTLYDNLSFDFVRDIVNAVPSKLPPPLPPPIDVPPRYPAKWLLVPMEDQKRQLPPAEL